MIFDGELELCNGFDIVRGNCGVMFPSLLATPMPSAAPANCGDGGKLKLE